MHEGCCHRRGLRRVVHRIYIEGLGLQTHRHSCCFASIEDSSVIASGRKIPTVIGGKLLGINLLRARKSGILKDLSDSLAQAPT